MSQLKEDLQGCIHDYLTCFWYSLLLLLLLLLLGEGDGTPLQYSCLENPMDGGAWKAAVHGVTEGQARLSDFTFTFQFHALKKEMAPTLVFLPGESKDAGAWWAAIYGVAQSRTRLKQLSSSRNIRTVFESILGATS